MNIFKIISINLLIIISVGNNIQAKTENNEIVKNKKNTETNYQEIINGLKNDYVIALTVLQKDGLTVAVENELSYLKKSKKDYQVDSANYFQAIIDIYKSDYSIIKYFYKFRPDTCYRNLTLEMFDKDNYFFIAKMTEKTILENRYYTKINNVALTLILNYYLNKEQKTIKLYFDLVYIKKNSVTTEELYQKLDKIFEKYGYEDKEKIRNAILNDFGKCIDQSQLTTK